MLKIVIDAAPPSANRMWRHYGKRSVISAETEAFNALVLATVKERVPKEWPFYRVDIIVEPRRRCGDVDNRIKPVLDALTKAGVWRDDKDVAHVSCCFGAVNKSGKTTVCITPMGAKYGNDNSTS